MIRDKIIFHEYFFKLKLGSSPVDTCWIWQGAKAGSYGQLRWLGSQWQAHRLAYHLFVAPIPNGFQVHHTCSNRLCVNPDHLIALSPRDHVMLHKAS